MRYRDLNPIVESSAASFPTAHFDELYHVGTLNPADKGQGSYEGAGLSVSLHPEEWREIARGTVSGATWLLTKPGNRFLDFHALTPAQRENMMLWGTEHGLCDDATTYSVTYFDDDLDDDATQVFDTREEAEAEREFFEWENEIVEHPGDVRSTPKLDGLSRQTNPTTGKRGVLELLAPLYAASVLSLDGVWWEDEFSPSSLSAPRGVIVPDKVSSWRVEKLDDRD